MELGRVHVRRIGPNDRQGEPRGAVGNAARPWRYGFFRTSREAVDAAGSAWSRPPATYVMVVREPLHKYGTQLSWSPNTVTRRRWTRDGIKILSCNGRCPPPSVPRHRAATSIAGSAAEAVVLQVS